MADPEPAPERGPAERLAHGVIAVASWLVPADRRRAWTEEWRAEVWHQLRGRGRAGRPASGAAVVLRCLGTFPHALWIRIGRWSVHAVWTNLRLVARGLRRDPAFTGPAVVVLALAVGAAATLFSAYEAVVLRSLTYDDPASLVSVWAEHQERGWYQEYVAPANLFDWREQVAAFEDVAAYAQDAHERIMLEAGEAEVIDAAAVSGNIFDVLGASPLLGRTFRMEETWSDAEPVTVLSHGFWQRRFGGDPDVLGRRVELSGVSYEVVGVMPPDFRYLVPGRDLWLTYRWDPGARSAAFFRRAHLVRAIARLAEGMSVEEATVQLRATAARLAQEYPGTNEGLTAGITPLGEYLVGDRASTLRALLVAVSILLIAACVNVGYLILVRWKRRRPEIAIRRALGAGSAELTGDAAIESVLLSSAGASLGVVLSLAGMRLLSLLAPPELLAAAELRLSLPLLLGAVAVVSGAGLLFAILPIQTTRGVQPAGTAARGTRSAVSARAARGIRGFVVLQVALSVVLISSAALLARSFVALRAVEPGFNASGVLTFAVPFPDGSDEAGPQRVRTAEQIERDLADLPGVVAAGAVRSLPVLGNSWTTFFSIESAGADQGSFEIVHRGADSGYFEAMQVRLVAGRLFDADEDDALMVNELFARRAFGEADPVGRRIAFTENPSETTRWWRIVGVVGNELQNGLRAEARPEVFTHYSFDVPGTFRFVVRTSGDPAALVPQAREVLKGVDSALPMHEVATLDDVVAGSLARDRFVALVSGAFALLAGLLAVAGVYGVTAQGAAGWQREFAVRIAVGARPRSILKVVLGRAAVLIGSGLALGIAASVWSGRFIESFLFETSTTDAVALVLAAGAVAISGAAAALPSAVRAMRTDAAQSLSA